MAWTIRLYNSDDTEIGWVQVDPYDYEITHPDGVDAWNHVRFVFQEDEKPVIHGVDYLEVAGTTFTGQTRESVDVSGRGHAEWVESNVNQADGVDWTTIADE